MVSRAGFRPHPGQSATFRRLASGTGEAVPGRAGPGHDRMDLAGLIIGWLGWEQGQLPLTFKMAPVASLILGIYSFTLPATPPTGRGEKSSMREMLGLEALGLLKSRS